MKIDIDRLLDTKNLEYYFDFLCKTCSETAGTRIGIVLPVYGQIGFFLKDIDNTYFLDVKHDHITFFNGSRISFFSLDNVDKVRGHRFNYLLISQEIKDDKRIRMCFIPAIRKYSNPENLIIFED